MDDAPIIYMDETSVNTWIRKQKTWQRRDEPVQVTINPKRVSVTIYGAIGNCLTKPVFMIGDSTNKNEFIEFLENVRLNLVDP